MLIAKCGCQVACLRSFKDRLSRKALETMYRSFILPQLDYGDVIWDNCSLKLAEEMESLHLDAIRTIIGAVYGTSHQKLYTESGLRLYEKDASDKNVYYVPQDCSRKYPDFLERTFTPTCFLN